MTPTREQIDAARRQLGAFLHDRDNHIGDPFNDRDADALRVLLAATAPPVVSPDVAEARAKLRRLAAASCFSREVAETIEEALSGEPVPLTGGELAQEARRWVASTQDAPEDAKPSPEHAYTAGARREGRR
jgi:hypothetical protein